MESCDSFQYDKLEQITESYGRFWCAVLAGARLIQRNHGMFSVLEIMADSRNFLIMLLLTIWIRRLLHAVSALRRDNCATATRSGYQADTLSQ